MTVAEFNTDCKFVLLRWLDRMSVVTVEELKDEISNLTAALACPDCTAIMQPQIQDFYERGLQVGLSRLGYLIQHDILGEATGHPMV
jgi:hypothetical protein